MILCPHSYDTSPSELLFAYFKKVEVNSRYFLSGMKLVSTNYFEFLPLIKQEELYQHFEAKFNMVMQEVNKIERTLTEKLAATALLRGRQHYIFVVWRLCRPTTIVAYCFCGRYDGGGGGGCDRGVPFPIHDAFNLFRAKTRALNRIINQFEFLTNNLQLGTTRSMGITEG